MQFKKNPRSILSKSLKTKSEINILK